MSLVARVLHLVPAEILSSGECAFVSTSLVSGRLFYSVANYREALGVADAISLYSEILEECAKTSPEPKHALKCLKCAIKWTQAILHPAMVFSMRSRVLLLLDQVINAKLTADANLHEDFSSVRSQIEEVLRGFVLWIISSMSCCNEDVLLMLFSGAASSFTVLCVCDLALHNFQFEHLLTAVIISQLKKQAAGEKVVGMLDIVQDWKGAFVTDKFVSERIAKLESKLVEIRQNNAVFGEKFYGKKEKAKRFKGSRRDADDCSQLLDGDRGSKVPKRDWIRLEMEKTVEKLTKEKKLTSRNGFEKVTSIKVEKLQILGISNAVVECINLKFLFLRRNRISKIEHLERLANLELLDLHGNEISEMSGLNGLFHLEKLVLSKNRIRKVEGMRDLRSLKSLHLENQELLEEEEDKGESTEGGAMVVVVSLEGVESCAKMDLSGNRMRKSAPFSQCVGLKDLNLANNDLGDLDDVCEMLRGCKRMESLNLSLNPVCSQKEYSDRVLLASTESLVLLDGKTLNPNARKFLMKKNSRVLKPAGNKPMHQRPTQQEFVVTGQKL